MATKKRARKPITTGKGTGYTKPVTPGAHSYGRSHSAKPSQAGRVRSALKTTSSGITKRPDGRAQSEGRSARQSTSSARVTSSSNGKPAGSGTARVTTGRGSALRNAAKVAQVAGAARNLTPATVAYETLKARPTAAGTKSAGGAQGPTMPKRLEKQGYAAQEKKAKEKNAARKGSSFDDAFRDARRAKAKTFTWRGKKYTTEMK